MNLQPRINRRTLRFGLMLRSLTAIIALMGALPSSQAESLPPLPNYIADQGTLRVGVKCDYQPAGFLGSDGKPTGIEVDMARHIAQLAGHVFKMLISV